ncbi:MAG: hypothetical protein JNL11_19060 [Bdellovibrionaceae bacterium]|nr:hypothetical protein [Pseudobdellovibrionaceae bacterium]
MASVISFFSIGLVIVYLNFNLASLIPQKYQAPLICVNDYIKYFSFGNDSQIADIFWIRFLQELDAYNQLTIAESHLCPDKVSSWHFHIMNAAFDLDPKFYELMLYVPLLISVSIGDARGASVLFDKAVMNFPNDWRVLYRASYQAQIEEKNNEKAAQLLYRAGKNGAPPWVLSLAGGLFNESGNRKMAEQIYNEMLAEAKDPILAERLKLKLESKMKNYFANPNEESKTEK